MGLDLDPHFLERRIRNEQLLIHNIGAGTYYIQMSFATTGKIRCNLLPSTLPSPLALHPPFPTARLPEFGTDWLPPAGCQPAGPARTACCPSPAPTKSTSLQGHPAQQAVRLQYLHYRDSWLATLSPSRTYCTTSI